MDFKFLAIFAYFANSLLNYYISINYQEPDGERPYPQRRELFTMVQ